VPHVDERGDAAMKAQLEVDDEVASERERQAGRGP
jgi:hypothetical protein